MFSQMFYSRYNPPPQVQSHPVGDSLTEQSHAKECDINNIIRNFHKTGDWGNSNNPFQPIFGDFVGFTDYRDCCDYVMNANDAFMSLPSNVRTRFQNSPAQLLDFINDSNNRDEAIFLGLIPKPASLPESDGS